MLVKIEYCRFSYGWILTPVNEKIKKQISKALKLNLCPNPRPNIFFQSFEQLENLGFIPANQLKELDKGYDVIIRVDNYLFLNLYGYDIKDSIK